MSSGKRTRLKRVIYFALVGGIAGGLAWGLLGILFAPKEGPIIMAMVGGAFWTLAAGIIAVFVGRKRQGSALSSEHMEKRTQSKFLSGARHFALRLAVAMLVYSFVVSIAGIVTVGALGAMEPEGVLTKKAPYDLSYTCALIEAYIASGLAALFGAFMSVNGSESVLSICKRLIAATVFGLLLGAADGFLSGLIGLTSEDEFTPDLIDRIAISSALRGSLITGILAAVVTNSRLTKSAN